MSEDSNGAPIPWAADALQEVLQISQTGVVNVCNAINKMGMEKEDQQKWVTAFIAQVKDLYGDMMNEITECQNSLLDEIEALLKKSEMLCKQLHLQMPEYGSEGLGLYQEQRFLKAKIHEYEGMIGEQRKVVASLNKQQLQLCRVLGRQAKVLPESPLPTKEQITDFKSYLESLEFEKFERLETFLTLKASILELVEELNYKPNLDFEKMVVSLDDSAFLVTDSNMPQLNKFYEQLKERREAVKEQVAGLRERLKFLWELLSEDLQTCNTFLERHTGSSLDTLQALQQEVKRCETLKKANIEVFVKRLRQDLVDLWDKCHFTDLQRDDFEYFYTDLYTEDLLTLHDIEIQKIKKYLSQNSELFSMLAKRNQLWEKMLILEERATAADRYKNRGGQLLKEEKERNALSKQIPKIEEQLIKLAEDYEMKNGVRFLSWGESVETIILRAREKHDLERKCKLSARKLQREKTITPGKSMLGVTKSTSTQNLAIFTPLHSKSAKRKIMTPLFPSKRTRVLGENSRNVPQTAPPKLTVNGRAVGPSRYSSERAKRIEKCRRISQRMMQKNMNKENASSSASAEYDAFEKEVDSKQGCRSTIFKNAGPAGGLDEPLALPLTPHRTPILKVSNRTPQTNNSRPRSPHAISKLSTAPTLKLLF